MRALCILVALVLGAGAATLRTPSTTGTVRWSSPASWNPAGIPQAGDNVTIGSGQTVLFDAVTARLDLVKVEAGGVLTFDNGKGASDTEIVLKANTIVVEGYLEIGREECPFERPARILLINDRLPISRAQDRLIIDQGLPPYGIKMLLVRGQGRWEVHGKGRNPTWTQLDGDVSKGSTQLTLATDIDWKVGDLIVVATTDFDPKQSENFTITAIAGKTITVDRPFRYNHFGRVVTYDGYRLDMRAEVAVLTSNVVIEGDMVDSVPVLEANYTADEVAFGGHTISIDASIVRLEGIEMRSMGQAGRLARYPVHWHHRQDAPGQYLKRSSIHHCFHRGVVIHDTNYVLVDGVVAFDTRGHVFYFEDGTEVANQMINCLAITGRPVGGGGDPNKSGYLLDDRCSLSPPGLRAQFLDYDPSGFWITNANNTIVGNHAVGCTYGFWIRVDYVFSEPAYPCVGCPCSMPRVQLPTITSGGLVMVDNYAHSNLESGIWIKENWIPQYPNNNGHPDREWPQYIKGFVAYKNLMGLEIYGIGSVNFENIIAADNGRGALVDWERSSSTNWTKVLLVGETENHGNPMDWGSKTTCSRIFPGVQRSMPNGGGIPNYLFKMPDKWFNVDDMTLVDMLPTCNQVVNPNTAIYPGGNLGAFIWTDRILQALPPDRTFKNIKFSRTFLYKLWGTNATFDEIGRGNLQYMGGYLDVDGSFPCSTPGSYFFHNTPSVVTGDCEYRSNVNMWWCPPLPSGVAYRQLRVALIRQYQYLSTTEVPSLEWECGKSIVASGSGNAFLFTVRTDKRYTLTWPNNYAPNGYRIGANLDPVNQKSWEGMEIVIAHNGVVDFEYYRIDIGPFPANPNLPTWVRLDPTADLQVQCACGVTYAKVKVYGRYGVELRPNPSANRTCSNTCGNPWPSPNPVGYTCAQRLTSDNKNITTCNNMKQLQTTPRAWVQRPDVQVYTTSPPPAGLCTAPTIATSALVSAASGASAASEVQESLALVLAPLWLALAPVVALL